MSRHPSSLGLGRRLLFTAVVFVGFLALLEGALSLAPRVMARLPREGPTDSAEQTLWCVGDSVTYGDGLRPGETWPEQLGAQLRERGIEGVQVRTEAIQGASIDLLDREDLPWDQMRDRAVLLVMLGHNDFMRWGGARASGIREQLRDNLGRRRERGFLPNLRLVRGLRWAWGAWRQEIPQDAIDEASTARFGEVLERIARDADRRGQRVYLLTYLVVGDPPDGFDGYGAEVLAATHASQPVINQHLCQQAYLHGVGLIDVQRRLMPPATFSFDWFQDHIHPTAAGAAEVARAVREALAEDGVLPAEAL